MTINEHTEIFHGQRVTDWEEDADIDPRATAVRIRVEYDSETPWADALAAFLETPHAGETRALLVGNWGETLSGHDSAPVVEALVAHRKKLPRLEGLFLGDIVMEESEISWINQSDVGPLFQAFDRLEEFVVRGGTGLSFGTINHAKLKSLTVQTGGLGAEVVREILGSTIPNLEHLELWLGDEGYGATTRVEDLAPLMEGKVFPKLKYLGLRNSEIVDEVAKAVAGSPILARVETLDLSMGTLGDAGAAALLASPAVKKLKKLDVHHHYCTDETVKALEGLGVEVDVSEQKTPDDWGGGDMHRYVSVSE